MGNLVIVESPSKAKTVAKYLGRDYKIIASKGHIVDLPKSELGVDVEHGFEGKYVISPAKKKTLVDIKKKLPINGTVYIASDPDREGEAIGWHIAKELGLLDKNGKAKNPKGKKLDLKRIVFHEITKDAILKSLVEPRSIDFNLVKAQQARRVLDRLVGYKLSPLLWTKIRYGLSAGRVQSLALRLIVERERERLAFISKEYWSIDGVFETSRNEELLCHLLKINDKDFEIKTEKEATSTIDKIKEESFHIESIDKKDLKKNPFPPFITSSLQQEANRKYGFTAKRTMSVAQKLYEGVTTPSGNVALISYMRTDSYNLSDFAVESIRNYINKNFGKNYLPDKLILYKKKSKLSQEAHEAIRPVDVDISPQSMKKYLSTDEFKLYDLIWKRSISCQMNSALFESISIKITNKNASTKYLFKSNEQTLKFDGFLKLYNETKDEEEDESNNKHSFKDLNLNIGEELSSTEFIPEQHFTQPPARFSEATLIKALEENGIGRPSTYAPIISTILGRRYVEKEGKYLYPTDVGYVVNDLLVTHFENIVDMNFTSNLEEELDEIANGRLSYEKVLSDFYIPFIKNLENKDKIIKKEDVVKLGESDEKCELCNSKMFIKLGKYGRFLTCEKFPDCKGIKSIEVEGEAESTTEICKDCSSPMAIKVNSKGLKFLGCSKYPECKYTANIPTGLICDLCGSDLVKRKSKWGKFFFGCSNYPTCKFILKQDKKINESLDSNETE